uniref:NADH-cytochrome b5 reductase n=1 Tax=Arcella intermedia TaxID=1963864 RepID=A0A6B2L7H2_9EUKA
MFHSFRAKGVLSGLEIGSIQGESMASRSLTAQKHKIPPLSVGPVQEEKSTKEKDKKNKVSLDKLPIHQSPAVMHKKSVTLFELSEISIMTHDTKIFRFKVDKQLHVPVGYHISIIHTINGKLKKRNYTPITDKPKYFEIMVKLYKTKKMSEHLHKMKPKEKIGMMGPFGKWKHAPGKYSRYIMLAAGTGITPMYQVLSALNAEPPPQPSSNEHATSSVLLYANKTRKDVLLKKKLDYWNCARFAMHYMLSDEPTPDNEFLKGQIDRTIVESVLKPNIEDKLELVLICGPSGFCSKAEEILAELQYPKDRIIVF